MSRTLFGTLLTAISITSSLCAAEPDLDEVARELNAARKQVKTMKAEAKKTLQAAFEKRINEARNSRQAEALKQRRIVTLQQEQLLFRFQNTLPKSKWMSADVRICVAQYRKANEELGKAYDKAIVAYTKADAKDRLQLVLNEKKRLTYQGWLGAWARPTGGALANPADREVWHIDIDPQTGEWKVGGALMSVAGARYIFHGEQVTFRGNRLSFIQVMDTAVSPAYVSGSKFEVRPQKGVLVYSAQGPGGRFTGALNRSSDRSIADLVNLAKNGPGGDLQEMKDQVDVKDAAVVARELARLLSFPVFPAPGKPSLSPATPFYMPSQEASFLAQPGRLKQVLPLLTQRHARLTEATDKDLAKAAQEASAIFRSRVRIADANERFGNTPTNSIARMRSTMGAAISWGMQREEDRAVLREQLRQRFPGYEFDVADAPWSEASLEKFGKVFDRLGDVLDNANGAVYSGLMRYADMGEADRTAELWQKHLLPVFQKQAAPAGKGVLEIKPRWMSIFDTGGRIAWLDDLEVHNASNDDIVGAVLELRLTNQLGDKELAYYYLDELKANSSLFLETHPRWTHRRTRHSVETTVDFSLWSPKHTEIGSKVKLTNPHPQKDPEGLRKKTLAYDADFEMVGVALGKTLPMQFPGPLHAPSQREALIEAISPGSVYVTQTPKADRLEGGEICIRFGKADGQGGQALEIFWLDNGEPIVEGDPKEFTGQLRPDPRVGSALNFYTRWTIQFIPDAGLSLSMPKGVFGRVDLPLIPMKARAKR